MEFSMNNLTSDELELTLNTSAITSKDDLGTNYNTECAFGNQGFSTSDRSITIEGYTTKYGKIRLNNFDTSNKATSVNIAPKVSISGKDLDVKTCTLKASVTDNRPVRQGVQTCDKNLLFTVTGCERVGKVLILDYTLQNIGDKTIENFTLNTGGITCTDDLGNNYYVACAFRKQGYSTEKSIMLEAGEMMNGRFRVSSMEATNKAEFINLYARCSSSDYVLEDKTAKFMKIPITDNRVLARGIQTCDRNLDFKFVSFTYQDGIGIIDYTITNTSNSAIQDFTIQTGGITCNDDLGNNYYVTCAFANQGFSNSRSVYIGAGETVTGHIQILKFNSGASYVNLQPKVSSSDYILDDPDHVYFLQIPTE